MVNHKDTFKNATSKKFKLDLIEFFKDDKYKEMLDNRGFEPLIEQLPWEDAGNVLFVRKTKKNAGLLFS